MLGKQPPHLGYVNMNISKLFLRFDYVRPIDSSFFPFLYFKHKKQKPNTIKS